MTFSHDDALYLLDLWQEKIDAALRKADQAEDAGNDVLASACTRRAFTLSEARVDLRARMVGDVNWTDEVFRPRPTLYAVPTREEQA